MRNGKVGAKLGERWAGEGDKNNLFRLKKKVQRRQITTRDNLWDKKSQGHSRRSREEEEQKKEEERGNKTINKSKKLEKK